MRIYKTINNFWISQYRILFPLLCALELSWIFQIPLWGIIKGGYYELMNFPLEYSFSNPPCYAIHYPCDSCMRGDSLWGCDLSGRWVSEHGLHVIHDALTWISHNISRAISFKRLKWAVCELIIYHFNILVLLFLPIWFKSPSNFLHQRSYFRVWSHDKN